MTDQQFKVLRAFLDLILKELRIMNKKTIPYPTSYKGKDESSLPKPVMDQEKYRRDRDKYLKSKLK